MMEIERKFLVRKLPDLSGIKSILYERYYLFVGNGVEVRIQKKNNRYEFERKEEKGKLSRSTRKFAITKEEFDKFKELSNRKIVGRSYEIASVLNMSIKIYEGNFQGLVRVEVKFESESEAENFESLQWFGKEITDTLLGRDSRLVGLSKGELQKLLKSLE